MAGKLGQTLKQSQSLAITPQLQQAIKLLTLTHLEMTNVIAQEMVENPLLEEVGGEVSQEDIDREEHYREAESEDFKGPEIMDKNHDDFDWDKYVDSYNVNSSSAPNMNESYSSAEAPNYENIVSKGQTLYDHLLWQIRMEDLSTESYQFAEMILGSLNDDGFLDASFEELKNKANIESDDAQDVLQMIQHLDPIGCASHDTKEALLIQARTLENHSLLVEKIITHHLEQVYRKDYDKIIKQHGCSLEDIKEAELLIMTLNPRPGRLISPAEALYVVPDIYVKDVSGELVVSINDDGVPQLRVSKMYQNLIQQYKKSDKQAKEYLQEKLRSASWLIKSIENRQKTIVKVMNAIIKFQPDFFRKGPEFLKPLILRDVATEIEMHESTVSRVTTNKYVHTPIGVYELKYFFSSAIGGSSHGSKEIASEPLKLKIKQLIDNENPKKPLSDEKIATLLKQGGIEVARRTVAKYRESMNILSSAKRRR